jgi:uncharacterized protein (TIGR03086 family)
MDHHHDLPALYRRSVMAFGDFVHRVAADQWAAPTPCEGWDVRQLVNHVAGENAWVLPLLDGRTIAEVGDTLDGDLLGGDPATAWDELAAAAVLATAADGALDTVVHVSFGDIPAREYLSQVTVDHVVHGWDLTQGIGAEWAAAPELVGFAHDFLQPQVDQWRAAGAFGERVEVPEDASLEQRLLGMTGRRGTPA